MAADAARPALDDDVVTLATGPNFAALTTLFPDGTPQTNIMWVDAEDGDLLVNTEVHRAKFRNMQADPRVSVAIWHHERPYQFVEVRGEVVGTTRGPRAREHIDELARRYLDRDDYPGTIASERVIVRIAPRRIVKRGF